MNVLADWGAVETIVTSVSGGIVAIIGALSVLLYNYKNAKKDDFKDAGKIIESLKSLSQYFDNKRKKTKKRK